MPGLRQGRPDLGCLVRWPAPGCSGRPGIVSYTLVAANVLVYLLHGQGTAHQGNWALWPIGVKYHDEDYYRLFTAGFVHFGFVHIAFNMIAL